MSFRNTGECFIGKSEDLASHTIMAIPKTAKSGGVRG